MSRGRFHRKKTGAKAYITANWLCKPIGCFFTAEKGTLFSAVGWEAANGTEAGAIRAEEPERYTGSGRVMLPRSPRLSHREWPADKRDRENIEIDKGGSYGEAI
jgi:hypothetical protein